MYGAHPRTKIRVRGPCVGGRVFFSLCFPPIAVSSHTTFCSYQVSVCCRWLWRHHNGSCLLSWRDPTFFVFLRWKQDRLIGDFSVILKCTHHKCCLCKGRGFERSTFFASYFHLVIRFHRVSIRKSSFFLSSFFPFLLPARVYASS